MGSRSRRERAAGLCRVRATSQSHQRAQIGTTSLSELRRISEARGIDYTAVDAALPELTLHFSAHHHSLNHVCHGASPPQCHHRRRPCRRDKAQRRPPRGQDALSGRTTGLSATAVDGTGLGGPPDRRTSRPGASEHSASHSAAPSQPDTRTQHRLPRLSPHITDAVRDALVLQARTAPRATPCTPLKPASTPPTRYRGKRPRGSSALVNTSDHTWACGGCSTREELPLKQEALSTAPRHSRRSGLFRPSVTVSSADWRQLPWLEYIQFFTDGAWPPQAAAVVIVNSKCHARAQHRPGPGARQPSDLARQAES